MNMKRFMDKFSEREIQILRIYNNKSIATSYQGYEYSSKAQINKLKTNKSIDEAIDLKQVKLDLPKNARDSQEMSREQAKYRRRIKTKISK